MNDTLEMDKQKARNSPKSKTDLFVSFTILALQGFGGVLAVVQRELVDKKQWLTNDEFVEDWSVAQILPGPNVVNLALMIGGRCWHCWCPGRAGWPTAGTYRARIADCCSRGGRRRNALGTGHAAWHGCSVSGTHFSGRHQTDGGFEEQPHGHADLPSDQRCHFCHHRFITATTGLGAAEPGSFG